MEHNEKKLNSDTYIPLHYLRDRFSQSLISPNLNETGNRVSAFALNWPLEAQKPTRSFLEVNETIGDARVLVESNQHSHLTM
jgi:hypothetical protein